jgi:hypothetical protein
MESSRNRDVVPVRQATYTGWIDSLEAIPPLGIDSWAPLTLTTPYPQTKIAPQTDNMFLYDAYIVQLTWKKKAVLFPIVLVRELLNFPGFFWGFEKEGTDIYVCTVRLFHHHFNFGLTFLVPPPPPPWVIADTYFPIWGLIPSPPERECLKDFFFRNKNFLPYLIYFLSTDGFSLIILHSFLFLSKASLPFHVLSFLVFHIRSFSSQPLNVLFFPFVVIYIPCDSFSLGIM